MFGERGRGGRPRKGEGPRVPYEDLDRILVFGEVVPCEDGNGTTVYYPSYRQLAERYGVSNSVIAEYAKSHNVQRRRKEAQARIQVKAEQKLVEMRAKAIAVSKDDELRIIDRGARVGPNSARGCPNHGASGGGAGPGAPGAEAPRGVVPRDCLETVRVSPSSPSSGRHLNPAGIAGNRDTAEQTAWADAEHGPPTVPDFRPEDAFADTLPPPPPDAEGECE